ncbi:D-glycerate 3-kinase [Sodiomyces alkalinus F11]|uniref:D-glycerate 3-kinase n=1 Tax=Sodiomyces alkalinus (strain CBS 110278 / VKM F-3762 / F11) TaxID=1314773 RepID=A0A3N2PW37_SODAK|nr:D-glycerate 3-kinase [Sodiomyces alkalinus F11]ROT38723.1 D-glycerate 3-kinase [Sodiomyces alkalinus F11]
MSPSTPTNPPPIIDDKSPLCIPFILTHLQAHLTSPHRNRPFLVGLNGVQGIGKTTLVRALATALDSQGHPTLVLSIDDLYLRHADQLALAAAHPENPLLQHRGQPGTHDLPLARRLFHDLLARRPARVPSYDKAAFAGQGDRAPSASWRPVNPPFVHVVIFEGWCVGFRALPDAAAVEARRARPSRTLASHALPDLLFVNDRLRAYDDLTDLLDAFVHLDAEDARYVYDWRREQEAALRAERGAGMSDEQVVRFVDGYYPAYELYADNLRKGVFPDRPGRQLRIVVGKDRKVRQSHVQ